jgi:HlyD family secretion protein
MDQIVNRPKLETPSVQSALGLNGGARRKKRGKGWLVALVAIAAVGAGIAWYAGVGQEPAKIDYTTVAAKTGNITVEVSATGTLQPLTQVDISSELSGIVRSVAVDENQRVKKGDVLAELDTVRLSAQVERAGASAKSAAAKVTEARTTLTETEQTLTRTAELARRGMATTQVLETATAARDRAKANVEMAEANLAIAAADLKLEQADLTKSTIYAPIDGIVLTRSVNPGQTVASSMQAPVLFVLAAELEKMELKAAVDEADIGTVKPGQTARFTVDAFPDRKFDADIREISFASVTTEGVVTYNAKLDVDNEELLLRPGMTATVAIVTGEAKDVITVPSAAFRFSPTSTAGQSRGFSLTNLFGPPRMVRPQGTQRQRAADDGSRPLYVLRNGAPERVLVKTGATDGEMTEITSGLQVGDQVITGASQARS